MIGDLLAPGLRIVFCGTALGAASARRRAYYAGPGNRFWPVLHAVGLTPRRLQPEEFPELLGYGLGLTDVCKTRSGSDAEVGRDAFDVPRLERAIAAAQPEWIAFNGKNAAKAALGLARVGYGEAGRFAGTRAYVLPSTSGAASGPWDVGPWQDLADRV